jgi:hypothetical protein
MYVVQYFSLQALTVMNSCQNNLATNNHVKNRKTTAKILLAVLPYPI